MLLVFFLLFLIPNIATLWHKACHIGEVKNKKTIKQCSENYSYCWLCV